MGIVSSPSFTPIDSLKASQLTRHVNTCTLLRENPSNPPTYRKARTQSHAESSHAETHTELYAHTHVLTAVETCTEQNATHTLCRHTDACWHTHTVTTTATLVDTHRHICGLAITHDTDLLVCIVTGPYTHTRRHETHGHRHSCVHTPTETHRGRLQTQEVLIPLWVADPGRHTPSLWPHGSPFTPW